MYSFLLVCFMFFFFFFFKQKTAYEMRTSDWSSDVCSSDLCGGAGRPAHRRRRADHGDRSDRHRLCRRQFQGKPVRRYPDRPAGRADLGLLRSEEHTSELQSLMRNSYAVFCLKKKKTNRRQDEKQLELQKILHQKKAIS